MFRIRRGLDLPIEGEPIQQIGDLKQPERVALLGADYPGLKPTLLVGEGEQVRRGQTLFTDKRNEAVHYTAPVSGRVVAINRGDRRSFISLEIAVDPGAQDDVTFRAYEPAQLVTLSREQVSANLLESGLWTALRARPYDKIPDPQTIPHAIFVNAMDTNPLAANPDIVIAGREHAFRNAVIALTRLTDGLVYICRARNSAAPRITDIDRASEQEFQGPHPSGLVGTHIHLLDPVGANKTVWHLNYQDAIAIGELFATGKLDSTRVISLAGPQIRSPRLIRTFVGAASDDLTHGEMLEGENRIVSGSALHGAVCEGSVAYLGRYCLQITVLREGRERHLLRYVQPGREMHSVTNLVTGKFRVGHRFRFTTTTNGSARAMVPIGTYEEVMPLDIQPTFLLRYLIVGDTDRAVQLGALELGEEDLALCTYVCPGKYEYGPILRDVLTRIEVEG
jgi:Na+-transporting NADH:ubiquinone oxidoreductase subunit A